MSAARVALLMGSKSDLPKLEPGIEILRSFEVDHTVRVMSAHRTPAVVAEFAAGAEEAGYGAIICAAGMAAHLAGVVAAHTPLPVLGIPVAGGSLQGMDALLSTVQMPGGVPVATFGVGSGGVKNAVLFAIQILARQDEQLQQRFLDYREEQRQNVREANAEVDRGTG